MIFTIAPLVQEANTRRRWVATRGVFPGVLMLVLAVFGAVVAWAGSTIVAAVTTRWAREAIASVVLAAIGATALGLAAGELGLWRSWLPRVSAPAGSSAGGLGPRRWVLALGFGATMAIFSPLPTYALLLGWVAARQSAGLGALTLASYGLGLMIPLAIAARWQRGVIQRLARPCLRGRNGCGSSAGRASPWPGASSSRCGRCARRGLWFCPAREPG